MNIDLNSLAPTLPFIGVFFTFIGGFTGYFIKDFLDRKKEINSKNNEVKRGMYKKFVSIIFDIFKNTKNGKKNHDLSKVVSALYDFYKDYALYSSPRVINAFGDCMQYLYLNQENPEPKQIFKRLAKVIREMRTELGLSNRKLGKNGEKIFRALFNDYERMI